MSYFLRFSDNFSWGTTSEGGKLPGLTNRNCCGSDFICDGIDGFSARFMWRRNGKGGLISLPCGYAKTIWPILNGLKSVLSALLLPTSHLKK